MAVDPNDLRECVGSFCRKIDENAADAYVMSPPAAVRLYSKFGFVTIGTIETEQGAFTCMSRASALPPRSRKYSNPSTPALT